jgi:hypothetical protein
MRVKKFLQRYMRREQKNLKVSPETHKKLDIARAEEAATMQDIVECCIELALCDRKRLRRLLEARTNSAAPADKG